MFKKQYGIRFYDDNKVVWFDSRESRDFYLGFHYKGQGSKVIKNVEVKKEK